MRRRTWAGAILSLALTLASCDSGPKAGDIVFDLQTPNQNDGAIQFVLTATAPTTLVDVTAECAGCQVFAEVVSDNQIRGVLLGAVAPGPVLRVGVSDRNATQAYTATVVAVADRRHVLGSTIGYALAP